ncbi:MAG: helix-turn-helix transcriptional regulator, partial [Dermatophilaceae bacterium]
VFIADQHASDCTDGTNPGPHALDARTRDRVRTTISEHGPLTAGAVASRLGLTPAAVRRHLDVLAEQGAIEEREPATAGGAGRGRGRPARAYILSPAGHADMESDYDDVATSVLRFLAEHAGADAVGEFARERSAQLEQRYSAEVAAAGDEVTARADALAAALVVDGFAASTRPVGAGTHLAGVQLCQGHCPVQHVAAQFPQFCDAETDAFSRLLGVHVQRLATLAHGEHVCTTFIPLSVIHANTSDERPSR